MWFNVDYDKLIISLLPNRLRKPILVAFVKSLLKPIDIMHYEWKKWRLENIYKIVHTGQRCYLRKALNDKLDPEFRRIYTGKGDAFPRKYIYTRAENKPVFSGKMFIYQNSEYLGTGVDFNVYVPVEIINTRIDELINVIDFYKLESKRYKIKPI
ncbi:conserved hypothetical protein [Flavobacterium psychrophilum]|nr:conserved hypothetical protein [Flavobacterium psychrophilum]